MFRKIPTNFEHKYMVREMKEYKIITALVFFTTAFFSTACSQDDGAEEPVRYERVDIGLFVSSDELPTTWNERVRSKVITSKGIFYVKGLVSLTIDSPVYMEKRANEQTYFCSDQFHNCKRMYGR